MENKREVNLRGQDIWSMRRREDRGGGGGKIK